MLNIDLWNLGGIIQNYTSLSLLSTDSIPVYTTDNRDGNQHNDDPGHNDSHY